MNSADRTRAAQRVYLNGRIVDRDDARVSAFDRGFLYGDGFFETTRIVAGKPVFLDRHLDRLASSCRQTGFDSAIDVDELAHGIAELAEANGVGEGYLRITVSRGLHRGRLGVLATEAPTVFAEARPMDLPPLDASSPLVLARSPYRRTEHSPVVRHKSLSYQFNVLALAEGRQRGADEVFFLNSRDQLTEGAITNLFFVKDGTVFTADVACGLLPGITRQVVLEICRDRGIPSEVGTYVEQHLRGADEVFCTNSLRGIMPVEKILDYPEKMLSTHALTRRLQREYAALIRRICRAT